MRTSACSCRARHRVTAATVASASSNRTSAWSAAVSSAHTGTSACASAWNGCVPGVASTAFQDGGKVGSRPARRNELLPAPDGPITPSSRGRFSFFQTASTSTSRPKKYSASCSVNAARPGYGCRSSTPGSRSVTSSRARASAWADGYRPSRLDASARWRTADQGPSGTCGGACRTRRHSASRVASPSRPPTAIISASTTPAENTSARASTSSPRACSGAMYAGVPAIVMAGASRAARATPKSMTTTRPARVIITFSGLKSRCTSPAAWIASSPARNCAAMSRASASGRGPRARKVSPSVAPSMYSIDSSSSPSSSTRSKMRHTFGESTSRAARTSRRSRSRARSSHAWPGRTAFSATSTRSFRSKAR